MIINKDIKEIFFSNEQIVARCEELGKQIDKDYEGKCPVLISLLNGAVPFSAELIKHITIICYVEYLRCRSYSGTSSTGEIQVLTKKLPDVKGKDVILIDDIFDTGLTMKFMKDFILNLGAASVKTCCLLEKENSSLVDLKLDYKGFDVQKQFVVGFGLDYNGLYRNFPYIGILKPEVYQK